MACDRPPSVLHLLHSLEGGGTEHTLVALLRKFDPTRLSHRVVTQRAAGSLADKLPDHVACVPLDLPTKCRVAGWRVAQTARRTGASLIHARNTGTWFDAIAACWLSPGVLPILGFHGLDINTSFTRRQRFVARLGRFSGARFASVSLRGRDQLMEEAGVPTDRIDVLPNGVDTDRYVPASAAGRLEIRRELGIPPEAVVVGTVGSLTRIKRHDLLLDAVCAATRQNPNIRLMVVGDGPLAESNRQHARRIGIGDRTLHLGYREDVAPLMAAMDLFVNCSDSEGMSNALLEALACGVSAVVTDVGDSGLIVRDGMDGTVVAPSSIADLTDAIVALVSSAPRRRAMGRSARGRAEQFSFSTVVARYEQWYQDLAAGKSRRGNRVEPASYSAASPRPFMVR